MKPVPVDGSKFRMAFVLLLVIGVSALFLAVVWPFLQALLFAAIGAGLSQPLFRWLERLFRGRSSLASAVTLLILFVLIAGPLSALGGLVVKQALEVSQHAMPWVQNHLGSGGGFDARDWLLERLPPIAADFIPSRSQLAGHIGTAVQAIGAYLVSGASAFTAGTAGFLLSCFVMIYSMFYFLKDGRRILERIFYYMPLSHEDEVLMLQRFASVTKATMKGTLLIGLIQGTLAGAAFFVAGINGAAFWGAVMVILSIVPGIGAALVWIPAVIYLFAIGQTWPAIMLAGWCAGVVGTIDNVLRPKLVGKDARMSDILILVGTLGGLFLFGPLGFIVGPIVCGLFLTVWEIYGVAFQNILPPVKSLRNFSATAEEKKETKD
jgi:predicted PurR-regulated permease PerM